jgi:NADPH2:quinone reductase
MQLTSLDGPAALAVADIAPPPAGDRLLIEVHAAGVCFADLLMTRGRYQFRPEPPFTPGVELAGIVREAPPDAGFSPGDRVVASSPFGAWAEYALASPQVTFPMPGGMSFATGPALINYQTAYFALVDRALSRPGETVLVHGAAGGVGTAAIDVARGLGLVPIAIARGEEKLQVARGLGAEHALDADSEWLEALRDVTGGRGVDIVFDTVGGDRFLDSVRALAPAGRLLVIGFAGGAIPEIKVNRLLLRNTSIVGVGWGEYLRHDVDMAQRVARGLAALWDDGKLHPLIGKTFPLERAADALRQLEDRRAVGKVVLVVKDG